MARTKIAGPVALLVIHGTAGPRVAYDGGAARDGSQRTNRSSVPDVVAAFVRAAGRPLFATTRAIDPVDDGMRVRATDHVTATGQVVVRLLTIEGGGHFWPAGRRAGRDGGTGDIDGNTEVLRFFASHPLSQAAIKAKPSDETEKSALATGQVRSSDALAGVRMRAGGAIAGN